MNELRDYQREMLDRLHEAWKRTQSVMVQMPTGTGKTHLMAAVIREKMAHGVLIVAHRVELIGQISQTLEAFGVEHGRIDRWTKDAGRVLRENCVVVASIQTLSRRAMDDTGFTGADLGYVIVDEAHHAVAKTYRTLWEKWPEAKFLGLTATPYRLNGTGFTDLFDTLLQSYTIQEFIDQGWLSDFEYVSVTPENWMAERIAGLQKRGADGDYQTKEMATVMDKPESIRHLYESYRQFAEGKKGIVYAINREHAQHISDYYASQGVRCCWIGAMTPTEERQQLVEQYRQGKMDVIVNVDIFSEGFDCPEVEFIQLARPTLSLSKYLQQVGRGMRPVPFKNYVVILDQVGLYQTFGLPTEERDWTALFDGRLTGRGKPEGGHHRLVLRDQTDLQLLNLQMVRIRRHGEPHQHVEVFLENGRYGVMRDGEVSCPAVFVRIRKAEKPYFALATYPFEVYHSQTTVIGEDGCDLKVKLYGRVEQQDDYIVSEDEKGRTLWYDGMGGRKYPCRPGIERIGGFDVVKEGSQYMLRKSSPLLDFKFNKDQVLVGPVFSIFKNVLVFNDFRMAFKISGYRDNYVIVETGRYPETEMGVMPDGTMRSIGYIPEWERESRPVSTGRLGLRRLRL